MEIVRLVGKVLGIRRDATPFLPLPQFHYIQSKKKKKRISRFNHFILSMNNILSFRTDLFYDAKFYKLYNYIKIPMKNQVGFQIKAYQRKHYNHV